MYCAKISLQGRQTVDRDREQCRGQWMSVVEETDWGANSAFCGGGLFWWSCEGFWPHYPRRRGGSGLYNLVARRVIDYSIEHRTIAVESDWNDSSLSLLSTMCSWPPERLGHPHGHGHLHQWTFCKPALPPSSLVLTLSTPSKSAKRTQSESYW